MPGIAPKKEKLVYGAAALVAVVALLVIAYLWLPREPDGPSPVNGSSPTAATTPAGAAPSVPTAAPTAPSPPTTAAATELDDATRARVAQLLDVAQSHYEIGRLTEPPGGNAFEVSQQVLELDPGNEAVLEMLADIAHTFEQLAAESIKNGDLEEGKLYLQQGLRVAPEHPGLKLLEQRVSGGAAAR